jgi:hypothetical protein
VSGVLPPQELGHEAKLGPLADRVGADGLGLHDAGIPLGTRGEVAQIGEGLVR